MAKKKLSKKRSPASAKKSGTNAIKTATAKKVAKIARPMSFAAATAKAVPTRQRVNAMQASTSMLLADEKDMSRAISVLRDTTEKSEVRLAALQAIQAATFSAIQFEGHRKDFTAALREIAKDSDLELRQRVLGILSREDDAYAQKLLIDGLKTPSKAVVSPEKALQLLSYNVHVGAFKVAKDLAENSPDPIVRCEALRLLSSDPKSVTLFEKYLGNKKEDASVRQMAATALHALDPEKLQTYARDVVLDPTENNDLQAMCLTAITSFGEYQTVDKDSVLKKRVSKMNTKGTASELKRSASTFVDKYSQ